MKLLAVKGFSLLEALLSLSIGVVFLAAVISTWYMSSLTWKDESVKSEIRFDVQKAMDKIKEDVRLSDGNGIIFYPAGDASYTAFSLPHALPDANGFYTVGATITWDQTIAYHLFDNAGEMELRRSVFNSYSSSSATRQTQLNTLVTTGSHASATTTTLFQVADATLIINPTNQTYDGYAASVDSTSGSFGSIRLASGAHTIQFRVTGKNTSSTGYRMGIDQITLTPSGGNPQEAEALTISGDSGDTTTTEDMSAFSSDIWGGNYQIEYASGSVGDYITFSTTYDQWMESNFGNMTFSGAEITGTNPELSVESRETQTVLPGWDASLQTVAVAANNPSNLVNQTVRNIISAGSISKSGQMVRFKFEASTAGSLRINSAYFGPRTAGTSNFLSANQIYFANAAQVQGSSDGVGAVGSVGATTILLSNNEYVWSNWMEYTVATGAAVDYLVSFAVSAAAGEGSNSYWNAGAGTHSYLHPGDTPTAAWVPAMAPVPGYTTDISIHALSQIAVWTNTGTATSQIYDTKVTTPAYDDLLWSTNNSGTYGIKVRTSANSDMSGASDWSVLAAYAVSPADLGAVADLQYVQFQATLTAASPYTTYPELDNVKINWPGTTALVEISGSYTKRPNYGTFEVLVDGLATVQALSVDLTAVQQVKGVNKEFTTHAEVEPKNTGR